MNGSALTWFEKSSKIFYNLEALGSKHPSPSYWWNLQFEPQWEWNEGTYLKGEGQKWQMEGQKCQLSRT